jgi:hypothetical protein
VYPDNATYQERRYSKEREDAIQMQAHVIDLDPLRDTMIQMKEIGVDQK